MHQVYVKLEYLWLGTSYFMHSPLKSHSHISLFFVFFCNSPSFKEACNTFLSFSVHILNSLIFSWKIYLALCNFLLMQDHSLHGTFLL